MSAVTAVRHYFSEAEYYEFENASERKHEYFQGEVYAMSGASFRHNEIAANVGVRLGSTLEGKPCRMYMSDQRLKVEASELITYPDIQVVCPPRRRDPALANTYLDATVIVEILSPSTASYDRGLKFDSYRQLPSLRHYVLIDQNKVEIEHRWKDEPSGEWQSVTLANWHDAVDLSALDYQLRVQDVYRDIDFNS